MTEEPLTRHEKNVVAHRVNNIKKELVILDGMGINVPKLLAKLLLESMEGN